MNIFSGENRKWDIIGFLNECHLETRQQLVECYLSSLEEIIVSRKGFEREKAQKLFDNYKKASIIFIIRFY